jgi:methyl-accepting chemotaxis protein
MNSEQFLAIRADHFADTIRARARRLRETADELDRAAAHVEKVAAGTITGSSYSNNFAYVASQVQHHVLWAVTNLNLDSITTAAYDLDSFRLNPPE